MSVHSHTFVVASQYTESDLVHLAEAAVEGRIAAADDREGLFDRIRAHKLEAHPAASPRRAPVNSMATSAPLNRSPTYDI